MGWRALGVPPWLLPRLQPSELARMRPDILILPTIPASTQSFDPDALDEQQKIVHIIEVGYGH